MTDDRGRYDIERLPDEGRRPGMYVIRDKRTGELVKEAKDLDSDESVLVAFAIRSSAVDWVRGHIYLAEAGCGRP